jgi:hypothetical protein
MRNKIIQPDAKGRICIGKAAEGIVGYQRVDEPDGRIVLIPMAAIPAREVWLYQNKEALESVQRGIEQSKTGKLAKWKSFASHAKEK